MPKETVNDGDSGASTSASPRPNVSGQAIPAVESSVGLNSPALARGLNVLMLAAAAVVVIAGLRAYARSLSSLLLAMILIVLVRPVQGALERRGAPRIVSFLALLSAAYGILLIIMAALAWSTVELVAYLADVDYEARLGDIQDDATDQLERFGVSGEELDDAISNFDIRSLSGQLVGALSGFMGVVSLMFAVLLTMLFMAMDTSGFVRQLSGSVRGSRPGLVAALEDFARSTRSYFAVSTVFGAIVAVIDVIALLVIGVPLASVWGVLSFITNFIPNVGFVIGLIPPALIAFLELGWQEAVAVVIAYTVINVVVQTIIQPKIVGDTLGLSATITFLSLVFWSWVIGPIGSLIAVPLTLLGKAVLIDSDPDARWAEPLISLNDPAASDGSGQRGEAARDLDVSGGAPTEPRAKQSGSKDRNPDRSQPSDSQGGHEQAIDVDVAAGSASDDTGDSDT